MRTPFVLLFLFFANTVFSKDIVIISDYTITNNRLDVLKKNHPSIFNEKNNIYIQYLGSQKFSVKEIKNHQFNIKCGFNECTELNELLNKIDGDVISSVRSLEFCTSIIDEFTIFDLSNLTKSEKKDLKKANSICILDLKGVKEIQLPDLIVSSSKSNVKAGESIELKVQLILNNISNSNGKIQWYINSEQIEGGENVEVTLDKDSQIKCVWSSQSCSKESNTLQINVQQCEYVIPYSLYFDIPQIFAKDKKDPNLIFIYPMNDANQSRVLAINYKCFFKDYEIELFDEDNKFIKKKESVLDDEKSQEYLMELHITNPNLKLINVSDLISTEEVIYVRITPKNLNLRKENMPKYKVFFTSCSPID